MCVYAVFVLGANSSRMWPRVAVNNYFALTTVSSIRPITKTSNKNVQTITVLRTTNISMNVEGYHDTSWTVSSWTDNWLAQLDKSLAALTHVDSCVQEVGVQSPQTILTQDSISPG